MFGDYLFDDERDEGTVETSTHALENSNYQEHVKVNIENEHSQDDCSVVNVEQRLSRWGNEYLRVSVLMNIELAHPPSNPPRGTQNTVTPCVSALLVVISNSFMMTSKSTVPR
jgi:hypothetical protein